MGYHTNVILSIGDQWNLICSDFVPEGPEKDNLLSKLTDFNQISFKINAEAVENFAGNCFHVTGPKNLSENFLIISERGARFLPEEFKQYLDERNIRICDVDIPVIEQVGGGSARCMVAGIY